VTSVIVSQCILPQSRQSHCLYLLQSSHAPTNVVPNTRDAIHHTPATASGYFVLLLAARIRSRIDLAELTLTDVRGLLLHVLSQCTRPNWRMFAGPAHELAYRLLLSRMVCGIS